MREPVQDIGADLERVRRLVVVGLEGHPARVYLFGSRATGGARRASDIDVAVFEERINLQRDGSKAKPYQVRQVRAIVVRYGLGGPDAEV